MTRSVPNPLTDLWLLLYAAFLVLAVGFVVTNYLRDDLLIAAGNAILVVILVVAIFQRLSTLTSDGPHGDPDD